MVDVVVGQLIQIAASFVVLAAFASQERNLTPPSRGPGHFTGQVEMSRCVAVALAMLRPVRDDTSALHKIAQFAAAMVRISFLEVTPAPASEHDDLPELAWDGQERLHDLFLRRLILGHVPHAWRITKLVVIPKKVGASLNSTRPILVEPAVLRTFHKWMLTLPDNVVGGIPGRCTHHAWGVPAALAFEAAQRTDTEKFFDCVPQQEAARPSSISVWKGGL